jgi:hypothetical protein
MVWSRQFALGLGHELPSVLAVLAALFGGLAMGAWILDERIQRSPIPGQWYGGLEIIIGVWSLCLVPLIPWANEIVLSWIGLDASFARHWLIAFGLPFLLLLPATFAMGATFPAMERFIAPCFERQHVRRGRRCAGSDLLGDARAWLSPDDDCGGVAQHRVRPGRTRATKEISSAFREPFSFRQAC